MRTFIDIAIVLVALILLANPKINFKPFSLNFETPLVSFGVLFMIISILCFQYHGESKGEKKGYEKGMNRAVEMIKNYNSEK